VNAEGLGQRHAAAAAIAEHAVPSRHFGDGFKHLAGLGVVAQPQPFLHRIGTGGMDQLVEAGIVEEAVRRGADRAPGADRRQLRCAVARHPLVGDGEGLVPGAGDDLAVGTRHGEALAAHLRDHTEGMAMPRS
jgi:hypothetical protein